MNDNIRKITVPDYRCSQKGLFDHIISFIMGFGAGFFIFHVFYKILPVSIIGGMVLGIAAIFLAKQSAITKRRNRLRTQFFDLLESMSVSLRAGNTLIIALTNAREDLCLLYPQDADIITELDIILAKWKNAVPLSSSFMNFAERSGLEDIQGFASVYATIEGKSGRANEIIRDTQQIIADKMEIELEIDTLMTAAKSEVNIMMLMPLVILAVIGYAGAGFMDAIYSTTSGRLISTFGLIIFFISFFLARKFSNLGVSSFN